VQILARQTTDSEIHSDKLNLVAWVPCTSECHARSNAPLGIHRSGLDVL